jgi:hypothetical protein
MIVKITVKIGTYWKRCRSTFPFEKSMMGGVGAHLQNWAIKEVTMVTCSSKSRSNHHSTPSKSGSNKPVKQYVKQYTKASKPTKSRKEPKHRDAVRGKQEYESSVNDTDTSSEDKKSNADKNLFSDSTSARGKEQYRRGEF